MKIYSSLKKVPVTKMYSQILTAFCVDKGQDFNDRTPFIVYLPCGKEGVAVGSVDELMELANAQTEGQTEGLWEHIGQDDDVLDQTIQSTCELAGYKVILCIEFVKTYAELHIDRKHLEIADAEQEVQWGIPAV